MVYYVSVRAGGCAPPCPAGYRAAASPVPDFINMVNSKMYKEDVMTLIMSMNWSQKGKLFMKYQFMQCNPRRTASLHTEDHPTNCVALLV